MRRSKSYYESLRGAWVNVPLANVDFRGGQAWCLGLVTHVGWRAFAVGHFFLPEFDEEGLPDWHKGLVPADAALVCQFSDEGILKGTWPVVGRHENWGAHAQRWRTPPFRHMDFRDSQWYLRYYNDDLTEFVSVPRAPEDVLKFPEDGFLGHVAVEVCLRKMVRKRLEEA